MHAVQMTTRPAAAVTALGLSLGTVLLAVPANARADRTPWHVSIKADSVGTVGKKVHITGKVARSAAGRLVMLQEKRGAGKPWRNQRDALVRSDGTYKTYDVPTANHARYYRVVMPATKRHQRGVSPRVRVVVYQWQDLTSRASVNEDNLNPVSSMKMNGDDFPASLEASMWEGAPTTQSIEYNLDHLCLKFRADFGISDDSETGSQASVTASADGTAWFSQTFSVGQYTPNKVTWATTPLKIRFQTESLVAGADGLGAVGTPQVYCTQ